MRAVKKIMFFDGISAVAAIWFFLRSARARADGAVLPPPLLTGGRPPDSGGLPQGVGWGLGETAYFISSNGAFFRLMRPCPASDNTVSRSVVRMSRA